MKRTFRLIRPKNEAMKNPYKVPKLEEKAMNQDSRSEVWFNLSKRHIFANGDEKKGPKK